jgi:hypothetical protein
VPSLCEELFGVPWAELDFADVESFFAEQGEEGLTWEAKGGTFGVHIVRKTSCGFGNSERGGFLILGIEGDATVGWRVEGMELSADPELQVGQTIRAGVRPTPPHQLKSWRISGNRSVVIVQLDPVAVPPAITSQGQVYERVTGETVPVRDPARLATLFARGKTAEAEAEALAGRAPNNVPILDLVEQELVLPEVSFYVAGAAMAYRDDIGSRLFTPETDSLLREAAASLCGLSSEHLSVDMVRRQNATFAVAHNAPVGGYQVDAIAAGFWDGSAAIYWVTRDPAVVRGTMLRNCVIPAWTSVTRILVALGGSSPARAHITLTPSERYAEGRLETPAILKRAIELQPPTEDEIRSVEREVSRAAGQEAHETE